MADLLYISIALCILALTGAAVPLLISMRATSKKAAESLDALNRELPGLLTAARLAVDEAREAASMMKQSAQRLHSTSHNAADVADSVIEGLIKFGGKAGGFVGVATAIYQGIRSLSGAVKRVSKSKS